MTKPPRLLHLRHLGRCDYLSTWQAMQAFTAARDLDSVDELWLLEHPPVFTLGQAGILEHVRHAGEIPVIRTDRGGQVTYHGPGQLVCYLLLDLRRAGLGVRQVVQLLEQAVILLLAELGITADRREQAPGVYVNGAKIAALGLRVRRGCSYHGLALNLNMDLMPFTRINPCGYSDLQVTQLSNCGVIYQRSAIEQRLSELFAELLGLQLLECE
ncbi:lipoyl(octanoyl) transferase LipB [Thiospirillum jenense]|uniref:lipoyl(octanoyl) transferase LipB n=1 Tax=Thiospirillum jenense TaxID=1653858 RepID=UPI0030B8416A